MMMMMMMMMMMIDRPCRIRLQNSPSLCVSPFLSFNCHFSTWICVTDFIEANDDGGGGLVVTTGIIRRAKFHSNRPKTNTNISHACCPSVTKQQCQSTE